MSGLDYLPALVVRIEGTVVTSTVDDFRVAALGYASSIDTALHTDSDFANAQAVVKWCKATEKRIKTAKEMALSQAAEIHTLFSALDQVASTLREKRLDLDRQVRAKKEQRKKEAIEAVFALLVNHVRDLEKALEGLRLPSPKSHRARLFAAAKGKSSMLGVQAALDTALRRSMSEFDAAYRVACKNVETLRAHERWRFLFSDAQGYLTRPHEDFTDLVKSRIAQYERAANSRTMTNRADHRGQGEATPERLGARDVEREPRLARTGPAALSVSMQAVISAIEWLIDKHGRDAFLERCGLTGEEYDRVWQEWRSRLRVRG